MVQHSHKNNIMTAFQRIIKITTSSLDISLFLHADNNSNHEKQK